MSTDRTFSFGEGRLGRLVTGDGDPNFIIGFPLGTIGPDQFMLGMAIHRIAEMLEVTDVELRMLNGPPEEHEGFEMFEGLYIRVDRKVLSHARVFEVLENEFMRRTMIIRMKDYLLGSSSRDRNTIIGLYEELVTLMFEVRDTGPYGDYPATLNHVVNTVALLVMDALEGLSLEGPAS